MFREINIDVLFYIISALKTYFITVNPYESRLYLYTTKLQYLHNRFCNVIELWKTTNHHPIDSRNSILDTNIQC